jgi:hypothetical protein
MKIRLFVFIFLMIGVAVLFTACGGIAVDGQRKRIPQGGEKIVRATMTGNTDTAQEPTLNYWGDEIPQIDEQGAVSVEIVPLNLNNPDPTLDFQVALNTHSVDLSMDLALLATLKTDTGYIVNAITWDAPLGGHHVRGILSFPADIDGFPILERASVITIRLVNLDVPERIFTWRR